MAIFGFNCAVLALSGGTILWGILHILDQSWGSREIPRAVSILSLVLLITGWIQVVSNSPITVIVD